MGTCCNLKVEQKVIRIPVRPLRIFFYYPARSAVYRIAEDGLKKIKMRKFKANKDCAIGHLHDGTIMLAGGIKTDGRLSKKVLIINPQSASVIKGIHLAKSADQGQLFQISTMIYYISTNLNQPHQKLSSNKWELISPRPINLTSASILIQENILYFLCGLKPNNKPTKKLYYLNIDKPDQYHLMKHKLNFKLTSPVSFSAYDFVVVAGGKKANGCYNSNFYIQKNWEWKELVGPDVVLEQYPVLFSNRDCVFICKDKKVVTLDSELKFKVYKKREKKLARALTERPKKENKIQKYRINNRYVQDMLNNYVFIKNKTLCLNENYVECSGSEFRDDESEKSMNNFSLTPTAINSSLNKIDNSPSF